MQYLPEFITVALVHLLAVMSPGPDFAVITKNSVLYSRKTAVLTALGLALGMGVHITYSLVGIGFIIAKSILLYSAIKYLGAAYLIYIGVQAIRAKKAANQTVQVTHTEELSSARAVRTGFLTNVLNPKATLFFLSLFTQVIHAATPTGIKMLYGLEMMTAAFIWFSLVAIGITHPKIKSRFSSVQHYFSRACGAVLIALGIKVAVSR